MTLSTLLQRANEFELQAYQRKPVDPESLKTDHVAFSGSPLQHPHHDDKLLLVAEPYSTNPQYYEFSTKDIAHVEKLPNLVNVDGQSVTMARIWVRKGRIGMRYVPFVVEDMAGHIL
ncbi:MAG: inorganic pyrophosphatase Ppa [Myxococcota bacterium]